MWLKKLSSTSAALALSLSCLVPQAEAQAQTPDAPDAWTKRKCALYTEGWNWVLKTQDLSGTSAEFISEHQRFIDTGCDDAIQICPVSKGEYALADLMTILSMNEGMASTFVPFDCPATPDKNP